MASRILLLARPHPLPLSIGVGISSLFAAQSFLARPPRSLLLHCDSAHALDFNNYQREARVPVIKDGRVNTGIIKQLSAGSITGLFGGLAVSVFSKSLAFLIGVLVLGVQALESRGIHIIPYGRLQRYFRNTDIKSALQDNVAFKLSFGATFALAGFAGF